MSVRLQTDVRHLIELARRELGPDNARAIDRVKTRFDGPLRVAIAGRVKAGKSTLLNALVGERLAPTDAGECTRVVSWYRHGTTRRISLVPAAGERQPLTSWKRDDGELDISLGDWAAEDVHHLDIEWPTRQLEAAVLIDTPGLASATAGMSIRSERYLLGEDDAPGEADAIVYLLRQVHPSDLTFLEAFRGAQTVQGMAINAIGVVSRADEIGGAGLSAMDVARANAERFADDPRMRERCQVVIPIAGLLAQGSQLLTENDHQGLRTIARLPRDTRTKLLYSAGRFCTDADFVLPPVVRHRLIDRIGLFGVRTGAELLARRDRSAAEVAAELRRLSGLDELRRLLNDQFSARARVLKCRTAIATIDSLARQSARPGANEVREKVRSIEISAHEFVEMSALQRIRSGEVDGRYLDIPAVERLLGGFGAEPWQRLDLAPAAPKDEVLNNTYVQISAWRSNAEDPLLRRPERDVSHAVVRSMEGIVADLHQG